ncbi:carbon-monoxide dehydrogenase catalytic subunit [Ruminobacter amylophilus]|uniref:Carbon-monoxide dehydrogenase catalytic subunit n=1 Tax=Ruminobacter amylophilus TaxID=867 RepID=A0A662ZEZ3_9GAMM|nr:carbon monoxide dehydrogenase [Ruminobacter amylophilus]SFP07709.1 carbon-monoxide dehydrogenase catalytic subunit [Ruminobacter amylophilus]
MSDNGKSLQDNGKSLQIKGIIGSSSEESDCIHSVEHAHSHDHGHDHSHAHGHGHSHGGLEHFHSHRNIIGFDEHGIPTVILKGDHHAGDEAEENEDSFIKDYTKAVNEYRKTFPSKQDVIENTPDPAVRDMILRAEQIGFDTAFDRFDRQKPQCNFGMAGICCKICNMGPCRITPKANRGVCGADADLIVSRNLLRAGAAGAAQHGMHAREVILNLKWAAEGKLDVPIIGAQKVKDVAKAFGLETENRTVNEIASELADVLLEDLSRPTPDDYRTIKALAPAERQQVWKELDIIPISAYHEVFEAYHKSGCGIDGDWRSIMQQFLRCGLAFTFTGVVATNIATDCLFGVGDRVTSMVNLGALKKGYVNIAVHGHLPLLVSQIVKSGQTEKMINLAREKGALGIRFYGICCSGLAAMYRYAGVIPLSNAVSAELVLGTGALDLWVADVQDVYPAIMDVARCFKTAVVTTSESARLPGAERFEFDHRHSNIGETRELADRIVLRAIESFEQRRGIPVYIPPYEVEAEIGFSVEYVCRRFGSFDPLLEALKSGQILGIVNMVGCNNTKVVYERTIIDVADVLLKNNVLILSNGCASFPLMKLGYCAKNAQDKAGDRLKEFLKPDLPPVWHVGECIDNTRSSGIFGGIAGAAGKFIYEMPFGFASPEWSNEKGVDAALGFRLMGVNSYHCVEAQIHGSKNIIEFLKEGTREKLKSVMYVNTDPFLVGKKIVDDMIVKRRALGWWVPDFILDPRTEKAGEQ